MLLSSLANFSPVNATLVNRFLFLSIPVSINSCVYRIHLGNSSLHNALIQLSAMTRPVPSRGPQILGVSISLVIVSGIIVGARILGRKSSTAGNRTNSDDWLIVIALVSFD